jgi:hypothetical protein
LLGLFVTPRPNTVTWQVDAWFVQKGGMIGDSQLRLSYIEVPLMVRVNIRPERKIRAHLLAGASVAYRLSSTLQQPGQPPGPMPGGLTSYEFDVVVGAGVDVGRFSGGVRISRGLKATNIVVDRRDTRTATAAFVFGIKLG